MLRRKSFIIVYSLLLSSFIAKAQIEVVRASAKEFKVFGFVASLNVNMPVCDTNFLTVEGGCNISSRRGLVIEAKKKEEKIVLVQDHLEK